MTVRALILRLAAALPMAALGLAGALADPRALPVPRITLYPGDAITAERLAERVFSADAVSRDAVHIDREGLVGKLARRTLLAGHPVPVNAVRDPHLVTQGRSVQLVFRTEGLSITGAGVALQSGGAGELVAVRNADTGIVVRGTIEPDGSVRVGSP